MKVVAVTVTVPLEEHSKEFCYVASYEEKPFTVNFNNASQFQLTEIYIHL